MSLSVCARSSAFFCDNSVSRDFVYASKNDTNLPNQNLVVFSCHTCFWGCIFRDTSSCLQKVKNRPITNRAPRLAPAGFGQQRPSKLSSLQAGLFWHNLDRSTRVNRTLVQRNQSLPKLTHPSPKKTGYELGAI